MHEFRRLGAAALLVTSALALVSCSGGAATKEDDGTGVPIEGGKLVYGVNAEPVGEEVLVLLVGLPQVGLDEIIEGRDRLDTSEWWISPRAARVRRTRATNSTRCENASVAATCPASNVTSATNWCWGVRGGRAAS